MDKILLFAGTTEGRNLAEFLEKNQIPTEVCVATQYGVLGKRCLARGHRCCAACS